MINFIFGPNIFLAIVLSIGVSILYFLRYVKPELAEEQDALFISSGLLYSFILIIHGWRLDPILILSQGIIVISFLVIGWENIRLRGLIATIIRVRNEKKL